MDNQTVSLSARLGELLLNRHATVTCAESCTGGGIASAITGIPGSSQWFQLGLVTYANSAKQQLLGLSPDVLAAEGAVSEVVVIEMARAVLALADADISVAVSGVAGPDGGTEAKPVGTVWFGWMLRDGFPVARCFRFPGDRAAVRTAAVQQALLGLIELLEN
tara:strand:- start:62 stop:550 length:489 start_codon:yes stop_codon:yes gene_type:complete